MKRLLFSLAIFLFLFTLSTSYIFAEITVSQDLQNVFKNSSSLTLTFTGPQDTFKEAQKYYLLISWPPNTDSSDLSYPGKATAAMQKVDNQTMKAKIPSAGLNQEGKWLYRLLYLPHPDLVAPDLYKGATTLVSGNYYVNPPGVITNPTTGQKELPAIRVETTWWQAKTDQTVYLVNIVPGDYSVWFNSEQRVLWSKTISASDIKPTDKYEKEGDKNVYTFTINAGEASENLKTLCMTPSGNNLGFVSFLSCDYYISGITISPLPPPSPPPPSAISNQIGVPSGTTPPIISSVCPNNKCQTAVGDIITNPVDFIKSIFGVLLSLSGGVAVVLILISGYRMMVSQGNPEKVQQAREQLTSAIVGLLFIIFSITILQIVGVDILHIPGLK